MAKFSLKTLAEDVLTLEINTIITADATSCKMPASRREALWGLATDYHYKLAELHCRGYEQWDKAGLMSFLELHNCARRGAKEVDQQIIEMQTTMQIDESVLNELRSKLIMLTRIKEQTEQIISMFGQLARDQGIHFDLMEISAAIEKRREQSPSKDCIDTHNMNWNNDLTRTQMQNTDDLELNPAQVSLLRKAWEIGTEQVLLQTTIQADGDVTTRLSQRFLSNHDPIVLNMHNESVQTSVQFWSNLVKTIREVAEGLLGKGKDLFG